MFVKIDFVKNEIFISKAQKWSDKMQEPAESDNSPKVPVGLFFKLVHDDLIKFRAIHLEELKTLDEWVDEYASFLENCAE